MRHAKKKITLGRERNQRVALMRALAESIVLHGSIETTLAKAKALRSFVEPLVTKAKRGTLADRRNVLKVLYTDKAVKKLFTEIAPKYQTRPGGYTRVTKLGYRALDQGAKARIEFV